MNKESLIAAGCSEELATKVMQMHQQAINGNYIPKATFEAEREKVKSLTQQVADRDRQITELGAFKGTAEQLQSKVTELEKQNKEAKEKYDADLLNAQRDAAIRLDIADSVIDPDDVIPKLDQTKIIYEDGKIKSGLKEQIDALKQSKPHYFKAAEGGKESLPKGWLFGNTPQEGSHEGNKGTEKTDAQKFGEMLASSKMTGANAAEKAATAYFK